MNNSIKLISLIASTVIFASTVHANEKISKYTLKTNYQKVFNKTPKSVEKFSDMFMEGMFYARLRSNTFYYAWEKETPTQDTHFITGIGGSIIYKSALYSGFEFSTGLYYSKAFFDENKDPVGSLKAGKDLLSRYNYVNNGDKSMGVLGEAYLTYKGFENTQISVGRQLVETFYTKSNDTKMIPNTFDGVVLESKDILKTNVKLAYLTKQKLRDHTESHSVLAYGDASSSSSSNPAWSENDDSAMHKGLTYTALKAASKDTDAPLIVGDISNKSIQNLTLNGSFYAVPELLSEVMLESNYKFKINKFTITPGVRYIKQFDNGAGEVGGAAYDGTPVGYKDATSLDSQMIAARLVGIYGAYKLNLGYSNVFDEADLITPWRGFPTAGYTRSMARYNWMANTKSYRIELTINANKTGMYKDLFVQMSALHTDADEDKGKFDEDYYYVGFVQNLSILQDLQWRLRLGYTDTKKVDADNLDSRFEINYLF
jgi:hypothetical protein